MALAQLDKRQRVQAVDSVCVLFEYAYRAVFGTMTWVPDSVPEGLTVDQEIDALMGLFGTVNPNFFDKRLYWPYTPVSSVFVVEMHKNKKATKRDKDGIGFGELLNHVHCHWCFFVRVIDGAKGRELSDFVGPLLSRFVLVFDPSCTVREEPVRSVKNVLKYLFKEPLGVSFQGEVWLSMLYEAGVRISLAPAKEFWDDLTRRYYDTQGVFMWNMWLSCCESGGVKFVSSNVVTCPWGQFARGEHTPFDWGVREPDGTVFRVSNRTNVVRCIELVKEDEVGDCFEYPGRQWLTVLRHIFRDQDPRAVWLWGVTCTRKTTLAEAVASAFVHVGRPVPKSPTFMLQEMPTAQFALFDEVDTLPMNSSLLRNVTGRGRLPVDVKYGCVQRDVDFSFPQIWISNSAPERVIRQCHVTDVELAAIMRRFVVLEFGMDDQLPDGLIKCPNQRFLSYLIRKWREVEKDEEYSKCL